MKVLRGYGIYLFFFSLLWAVWQKPSATPTLPKTKLADSPWFLPAEVALSLPKYKILDTRSAIPRLKNKVSGAVVISWEDLSRTDAPQKGNLLELKIVRQKINDLGFKLNENILVLGDGSSGWGEEGRIVWSLREAGFKHSYWIDGGFSSYEKQIRKKNINSETLAPTHSDNNTVDSVVVFKDEIVKGLQSKQYQILDTREPREFTGATPYGESRGGHIPGAKSFFYQELFDANGKIKTKSEVELYLKQLGIQKEKPIVAYCTGGVRSAFVVGILRTYGYNAYNYAGSMWEWSSDPKLPLETGN